MINNLLYKRLKKLGACESSAKRYKGKSMVELWATIDDKWDFHWLLGRLAQRNYLQTPHIYGDGWDGIRMQHALHYADPQVSTRRSVVRYGRQCVEAMQTLVTFRQVSRALAKIKV